MKNLKITLLLLAILIANTTFSQTKEETVKYINDIVSASKGIAFITQDGTEYKIIKQQFSLDEFIVEQERTSKSGEKFENIVSFYSEIPWITLNSITRDKNVIDLVGFHLTFDGEFKDAFDNRVQFHNHLVINVIPSKAANVEKALKHLQELFKKEDPFGN
uniref:hypothetical protein n=1 Tax=Flavobacterium sp. TaxID=239 RepID=UPI0040496561